MITGPVRKAPVPERTQSMIDAASQLLVFAHVVEHGSFSASARALGLTPSAVSRQISRLEDRLGVRLLTRSTRHIVLTEAGRAFYERCAAIAAEIDDAEALVTSLGGEARGTLRVNATVALAKSHLLPMFPEFLKRYPDISLRLELTDRPVDMVEEEIDVAIRFTEQVTDTSVVARRLAANQRVVCAAPGYLEHHGTPTEPEHLLDHNCLRVSTVSRWNDWAFDGPGGRRVLHVSGNFEANSADAVYHAALAGLGVARLSTYLVSGDLKAGRLVHLLPGYVHEEADILAIYPERKNLPAKVRVFVDFLAERFGPVPPWEQPEAA